MECRQAYSRLMMKKRFTLVSFKRVLQLFVYHVSVSLEVGQFDRNMKL